MSVPPGVFKREIGMWLCYLFRSYLKSCWNTRSSSATGAGPPAAREERLNCTSCAATSSASATCAWRSRPRLRPRARPQPPRWLPLCRLGEVAAEEEGQAPGSGGHTAGREDRSGRLLLLLQLPSGSRHGNAGGAGQRPTSRERARPLQSYLTAPSTGGCSDAPNCPHHDPLNTVRAQSVQPVDHSQEAQNSSLNQQGS